MPSRGPPQRRACRFKGRTCELLRDSRCRAPDVRPHASSRHRTCRVRLARSDGWASRKTAPLRPQPRRCRSVRRAVRSRRVHEPVLARRDENWKKLQQYILDEDERLHLYGPDGNRFTDSPVNTPGSSGRATSFGARVKVMASRSTRSDRARAESALDRARESAREARSRSGPKTRWRHARGACPGRRGTGRRSKTCSSNRSSRASSPPPTSSASSSIPAITRWPAASN